MTGEGLRDERAGKQPERSTSERYMPAQSGALFLLVGTNPLPNYVAGMLLAKPGAHLYFVHTSVTGPIADRLAQVLQLPGDRWTKIPVEEADARNIYEQVTKAARGKKDLSLNYTGGTKAMAVHAYRAVQDIDPQAVCSYLDARTLEMRIDYPQKSLQASVRVPVALSLQPTIKTLVAMHGYTIRTMETAPQHIDLCQELVKVPLAELRKWCDNELKELRNSGNNKPKRGVNLKTVSLPVAPPFDQVARHWQPAKTIGELAAQWKASSERVAKFLGGQWLEDYTAWALLSRKETCHIHDLGMGFRPNERDFEFDVMAMRGYQLFAISCTTSQRKALVKEKLFEAFVRARQMGGEEARVGVVSGASKADPAQDPARIQAELEESWDAKGKIRVLGVDDWPNLPDRLQDWLNT